MAVSTLCKAFQRFAIVSRSNVAATYSTQISRISEKSITSTKHGIGVTPQESFPDVHIKFEPRTLNIDFSLPVKENSIKNIIDIPLVKVAYIDEMPNIPIRQELPVPEKSLELPPSGEIMEKRAERMIVIRRAKMKKHKLKKLRKKMHYVWKKRSQRRELAREKAFHEEQIGLILQAQKFDPEQYIKQKLETLTKERLPLTWQGEYLPSYMIRQFLAEKQAKEERKRNKPRLTSDV